jgi:hypothetical protein
MSMETAAAKKQKNLQQAAQETGKEAVGVYSGMMPGTSTHFSHMPASLALSQMEALDLPKSTQKAFVSRVQAHPKGKGFPDLELTDPELRNILLGEEGATEGAGALRVAMTDVLSMPGYQAKGMPHYGDIMDLVNDPRLADYKRGDMGASMFTARPSEAITKNPNIHQSYDTIIPGDYYGGFDVPVPPEIMMPDVMSQLSQQRNKLGQPLSRDEQIGSLMMRADLYQEVTPELVSRLDEYLGKARASLFDDQL